MQSLVLVAVIVAVAPLLAGALSRWLTVPLVVFEIVLGILFGPQVAGWITEGPYIEFLAQFGLAMLFFLAGYEIDFERIRGRPLRRSAIGWLLSLVLGVLLGIVLAPTVAAGVLVGICLTSTALGTILPVLRDGGELPTPFGAAVLAVGAVGEFGPLIAIALFLSGRKPGKAAVILTVFTLVIAGALIVTAKYEHVRVHRLIEATMHTSGQFAVRLVILVLAALVALASSFGLDMLLGAFGAGMIINLLLAGGDPSASRVIEGKLDAVGYGFLVPVFFVNTGVGFDLDALTGSSSAMALVPVFLLLFLVVRGIPATLTAPVGSGWSSKLALALFGATGLPIIVAVTAIGLDDGVLKAATAAALLGAGILSVLLFPLLGLTVRRRSADAAMAS